MMNRASIEFVASGDGRHRSKGGHNHHYSTPETPLKRPYEEFQNLKDQAYKEKYCLREEIDKTSHVR